MASRLAFAPAAAGSALVDAVPGCGEGYDLSVCSACRRSPTRTRSWRGTASTWTTAPDASEG
jgi:hypothetical protein